MKKSIFLVLLFILPIAVASAQSTIVSGRIYDQANQSIVGANVVVMRPADSSMITGTTTDINGRFKVEVSNSGKVLIRISFIGFQDLFIVQELKGLPVKLGKIILKDKATELEAVQVMGEKTPVIQKGDTTEINAGAFKTNPDANAEDLVTKMPGISMQDGKVQAHGEAVQKVTVDGQDYFGDDASATLKNLPAEVVDKIEIFDKKSEQSEATGFDDGNTTKTINIVTKTQFRDGAFGKAFAGYGYDDKWKGGMNLNFFKGKRRFSVLASTNNINEQNFSSEDLLGVMSTGSGGSGKRGGGRPGGGGSSNDAGNFLVDQKSGVATTHSFGVNYANQWKKVNFSASYFLNYSDNNAISDLYRQYITAQNDGYTYSENQENSSQNLNHRLNFKLDWKMDSLNSIKFQPKISFQQNDAKSQLEGRNNLLSILQSLTDNKYKSNLDGMNFSAPLQYRHAFAKKGRTFSVNVNPGYSQNKGNSYLNSWTMYYADTLSSDLLDQMADRDVNGLSLNSSVAYTEPVTAKSQLMFSYKNSYNKSNSDKELFNYSDVDLAYTNLDTVLSNKYNSRYLSQSAGIDYRYQQEKWNLTTGLAYQYAQLHGAQVFPVEYSINKVFVSVLPSAQFQYKYSKKKILRINYRSSNKAPTVSQLQNVIDNANPLLLSTGNPNLKQNWQNSLSLRFSSSNTEKSKSFMTLLSATLTQNYIVNHASIAMQDSMVAPGIILAKGSQITRPINMDGYFNLRSFTIYSLPIPKLKSNMNLNVGGAFTHAPGMINNQINYANSYNVGFGLAFSSNISEYFDFLVSSNTTYNMISNTLQSKSNSEYYNQSSKLKIQAMPWKWMVLQTDINHQYNSGLSEEYNQNYFLWNAAIGCKLLKDQRAELRLSVYDILKQNNSITRNTTETYYEDVQTNVQQRYLMLTFTYNIKYYKSDKPAGNE